MYGLQDLEELAEAKENLDFRMANAITTGSLWCLVRLDEALSNHQPSRRLIEPSAKLHSLLPFSDDELHGLAERMKAHEAPGVPEDAWTWWLYAETGEDVVLMERWRRWLDENLRGDTLADPTTEAHQMITALKEMTRVISDIL
jgi:hypothetical protein